MAAKKTSKLEWVPFDDDGDMLNFAYYHYPAPPYGGTADRPLGSWRRAEDFHAVLQFQSLGRAGRSKVAALWKDVLRGGTYTMFLSELSRVVAGCHFVGVGLVDGRWRFHKRGANYGIGPVLDGEE